MLKNILICFLLAFPYCCFSQLEATSNEVSIKNSVAYKNNKRFTGVLYSEEKANNDCQCLLEANYKNGLINGFKKEYYNNGNLKYSGKFLNGKEIGIHNYYDESGKLTNQKVYKGVIKNDSSKNKDVFVETKKVLFSSIRYSNFLIGEWHGDKGGVLNIHKNGRATYKYSNVNDAIDGKIANLRWSYFSGKLNLIFPKVTSKYRVNPSGTNRISLYSINNNVFFDNFEKKSNTPNNTSLNSKNKIIINGSNRENKDTLLSKAENGDKNAQYKLATYYFTGTGVKKDVNQAFIWYKKAAENGLVKAQEELAALYFQKKDFSNALIWYTKAANNNHLRGQYELGYMYRKGIGVKKSRKKAKFWWKKSCNMGYTESCNAIKQMNAIGNDLLNSVNESVKRRN